MRRGITVILVVLLLVLVLAVAAVFLVPGLLGGTTEAPAEAGVDVVAVSHAMARDTLITEADLIIIKVNSELVQGGPESPYFHTIAEVTNSSVYTKYPLSAGMMLSKEMVGDRPGLIADVSATAKSIPLGMTAVTIPITRLGLVGYGVKDGDHVNLIATTRFVDLDASFQSALPNLTAAITGTGYLTGQLPLLTITETGNWEKFGVAGRAELDPALNEAVYVFPREVQQRPRLVSQMILQDIQVLHIGDFGVQAAQEASADGTPPPPPPPADIITLIVNPQDAISLTYLVYSGARITMALRPPDDPDRKETEAVTMQYLLSQYNIPVPPKLPYGFNPGAGEIEPEPTDIPKQ